MLPNSKLIEFGYSITWENTRINTQIPNGLPARVIAEHRERYTLQISSGECEAEITGSLRFSAQLREDFPVVGDWVLYTSINEQSALIHSVLPRQSVLSRKSAGRTGDTQPIAANVDVALIVQSLDRDTSTPRLERYLSLCYTAKVKPVLVLTKADLIESETLSKLELSLKQKFGQLSIIPLSNIDGRGIDTLKSQLTAGNTYCLLGSSGVGKSTLLNRLCEQTLMKTSSISTSTGKGRHTTSHRELIMLPNGALLIDNPGMREVGMANHEEGIEATFHNILELADNCRFRDCTHTIEKGCAIIEAVELGHIDSGSYQNLLKLFKEQSHFQSSYLELRKKEKEFGRRMKNYYKQKDSMD